jgi:hypothetical protein
MVDCSGNGGWQWWVVVVRVITRGIDWRGNGGSKSKNQEGRNKGGVKIKGGRTKKKSFSAPQPRGRIFMMPRHKLYDVPGGILAEHWDWVGRF